MAKGKHPFRNMNVVIAPFPFFQIEWYNVINRMGVKVFLI